jgi:hypothetical protein
MDDKSAKRPRDFQERDRIVTLGGIVARCREGDSSLPGAVDRSSRSPNV